MHKRIGVLMLSCVLMVSMFTGCESGKQTTSSQETSNQETSNQGATNAYTDGRTKLYGLEGNEINYEEAYNCFHKALEEG